MLDEILTSMFREVYNRGEIHYTERKHFPRECFTQICDILAELNDLNDCKNIHCDVKLSFGSCSVAFTYFEHDDLELPFDKKVKKEFQELGII